MSSRGSWSEIFKLPFKNSILGPATKSLDDALTYCFRYWPRKLAISMKPLIQIEIMESGFETKHFRLCFTVPFVSIKRYVIYIIKINSKCSLLNYAMIVSRIKKLKLVLMKRSNISANQLNKRILKYQMEFNSVFLD